MSLQKQLSKPLERRTIPSTETVKGDYVDEAFGLIKAGRNIYGEVQENRLQSDVEEVGAEFSSQQDILNKEMKEVVTPEKLEDNPVIKEYYKQQKRLEKRVAKGFMSPAEARARKDAIYREYITNNPSFAGELTDAYKLTLRSMSGASSAVASDRELWEERKKDLLSYGQSALGLPATMFYQDPVAYSEEYEHRAEAVRKLKGAKIDMAALEVQVKYDNISDEQATEMQLSKLGPYINNSFTALKSDVDTLLQGYYTLDASEKAAWLEENGDATLRAINQLGTQFRMSVNSIFYRPPVTRIDQAYAPVSAYLTRVRDALSPEGIATNVKALGDVYEQSARKNLLKEGTVAETAAVVELAQSLIDTQYPIAEELTLRKKISNTLLKYIEVKDNNPDTLRGMGSEQAQQWLEYWGKGVTNFQENEENTEGLKTFLVDGLIKNTESLYKFPENKATSLFVGVIEPIADDSFVQFYEGLKGLRKEVVKINVQKTLSVFTEKVESGVEYQLSRPIAGNINLSDAMYIQTDSEGNIAFPITFRVDSDYINSPKVQEKVSQANTVWAPKFNMIIKAYSHIFNSDEYGQAAQGLEPVLRPFVNVSVEAPETEVPEELSNLLTDQQMEAYLKIRKGT